MQKHFFGYIYPSGESQKLCDDLKKRPFKNRKFGQTKMLRLANYRYPGENVPRMVTRR